MKNREIKTLYTSFNNDYFLHDCIENSYRHLVCGEGFEKLKEKGIITIFCQEGELCRAGDFIPNMIHNLSDLDDDTLQGDHTWLNDIPINIENELNNKMAETVNEWANKYNLQPKIYQLIGFPDDIQLEPISETEFKIISQSKGGDA